MLYIVYMSSGIKEPKYSFNTDEIGRERLDSAMSRLLQVCQEYRLPMFVSVAVANTPKKTEYVRQVYTAQSHDLKLTDDEIRRHVLISRGFDVIPPRENITESDS